MVNGLAEWKETAILEIIDIIGGGTPKTSIADYWNGEIPWLSVKDFNNDNRYVYDTEKHISDLGLNNSSTKLLQRDDIIISARGTVGEIAMIPYPMAFNQSCYGIRAKAGTDKSFLYYLLKYKIADLKRMTHGSVFDTITRDTFANLIVSLPPYEIQRGIASVLMLIDDKIECNSRINDNLEQQASAMVDQYFESVSSTVSFSDIMSFESGFAFQSSTYLPNGQYRIITIKNVQDGQIDTTGAAYIDELPQRMKSGCLLQVGDALLSLTGNVGRTGIVCENGLLLNQRVAKIVPHRKELLPLLYFIFRQPSMKTQLESIAKGTAQLNLSPVETLKLSVPYDVDVSLKLANALAPIYQAVIANNQQSLILASIRDLLLPKLMSGEIDVSDIQL